MSDISHLTLSVRFIYATAYSSGLFIFTAVIPLWECTRIYLSILLLTDDWVVTSFELLGLAYYE